MSAPLKVMDTHINESDVSWVDTDDKEDFIHNSAPLPGEYLLVFGRTGNLLYKCARGGESSLSPLLEVKLGRRHTVWEGG